MAQFSLQQGVPAELGLGPLQVPRLWIDRAAGTQARMCLLPACAHATPHLLLLLRSTACEGLIRGHQAQSRAETDKGSQCQAAQQQTQRGSHQALCLQSL